MRILFVLPELPHPPFTGAHTRPLTLMRAAALRHQIAVVGAAPDGADLSLLRELCDEVRVAPAGAARPARRRALAAGRRLVTPVPLVSLGRSRAIAELVDEMVASWKPDAMLVETLYAAHYRAPDVPLIVDMSGRAQRPLRVRGRGPAGPLRGRQPAGRDQPPLRAPPAGRHGPDGHQRRRPGAPRHARRRGVHRPAGDRPAAGGRRSTSAARACGTTSPCACSSSARSSTRPTATRPSGWSSGSRPSCAPSACRSPWSSPACRPRRGSRRPAAPASPSSPTRRTSTRCTAARTSCSHLSPTAAAPRTRRSRRWPGGCR